MTVISPIWIALHRIKEHGQILDHGLANHRYITKIDDVNVAFVQKPVWRKNYILPEYHLYIVNDIHLTVSPPSNDSSRLIPYQNPIIFMVYAFNNQVPLGTVVFKKFVHNYGDGYITIKAMPDTRSIGLPIKQCKCLTVHEHTNRSDNTEELSFL